jgi:DNA-directed RNA polymerase specialized sigma subunit
LSKLKRGYQAGVGNIKTKDAYDPFPRTGLVKQYEGFIRGEVRDYCKQYPNMRYEEMLAEAVKIAIDFEPKFRPETGYDFSTPLRHHLKGLHRFAQNEFSSWQIPVSKWQLEANRLEQQRNGIGGDDPRVVNFLGGGNGARITLDFQWTQATPVSDITVTYGADGVPPVIDRHRVVIGTQLRNNDWDHANRVVDRATPDVKVVLEDRKPSPTTRGYARAIMAWSECRQREADQEAENQRHGDYAPVFLKPDRMQADIEFYKGREPPKLNPDYIAVCSLSDAYTHDDDWVGNLADTIADGAPANAAADYADQLRNAAETDRLRGVVEAERPFLSPKQATVLNDWLLGNRSIAEVADKVGMTKGGVSKMATRIAETLVTRLKDQK